MQQEMQELDQRRGGHLADGPARLQLRPTTRSGTRERGFCHSCWTPSSGCAGREATLRLSESCSGWRCRQGRRDSCAWPIEESLAALDLIEQMAGYALLKGYFEDVLAMVLYQRNRLEEARGRLRTVIQDAATWQQSDLLLSGYIRLMQVELARGDLVCCPASTARV